MSGSVRNAIVIALLANVKKVIGNQLVIDLQGAGSIDFMDGILYSPREVSGKEIWIERDINGL